MNHLNKISRRYNMNELSLHAPQVDTIVRFQSLQSGQYWKATTEMPSEGIDEGVVLLICSLRWVEDSIHTVILRPHPSKIGSQYKYNIHKEDGSIRTDQRTYREHRFLLKDFLSQFEFEPNHQQIRNAELRCAQEEIAKLQRELVEGQSNPAILAAVLEQRMHDKKPNSVSPNEVTSEGLTDAKGIVASEAVADQRALVSLSNGSMADAIESGLTIESIAELKKSANNEHKMATIKAEWIKGKTNAIAEAISNMTPFYQELAAAALAQTDDVRSYVDKLLLGIESLDLYVGKDVDVLTIREGMSAPRDVPLTFVQKKLRMDEELAAWADLDESFDYTQVDKFFEVIRTSDALVNQIFPTQRCVLVMCTTERYINYGDSQKNQNASDINRCVFMLIRDGMNIYRVYSGVESHLGAARLFPSKNDHDAIFSGLNGSTIKFEDVAYTDRLAAHEKFALHYKRFLLLACGLDHRLKLFGDFYDGPPSFKFVSLQFQSDYCRFLHDDDGTGLLAGRSRLSQFDWIAEKNGYLRSGSRVLCKWVELMNPTTAPGACKKYSAGSGFETRASPENEMDCVIAYREGTSICVDIEVFSNRYGQEGKSFMCKVNLSKVSTDWAHVDTPFLCLDAILPEELTWYIHNRAARVNHLAYIRFFKSALQFIERELSVEGNTRQRLSKALEDGHIAVGADAALIVNSTVIAWRAANRGKPLPLFVDSISPDEWKSLLDQMYMLAGEGKNQVARVEAFIHSLGYVPLRLVLSGKANFIIYAAPSASERDDRVEPHSWAHKITLGQGKTKLLEKSRRWVIMPKVAASETTIHEWQTASEWCVKPSAFGTYENKQRVFATLELSRERISMYCAPMSIQTFGEQLDDWAQIREQANLTSKYVSNPTLAIPIGVVLYRRSNKLSFLCVGSVNAFAKLGKLAPDQNCRNQLKNFYVDDYEKRDAARDRFEQTCNADTGWSLMDVPVTMAQSAYGVFADASVNLPTWGHRGQKYNSPLLSQWIENWKKESLVEKDVLHLSSDVIDNNGNLTIDALLGVALPIGFEALDTVEIKSDHANDGIYNNWIDVYPAGCNTELSNPTHLKSYSYQRSLGNCNSQEGAKLYIQGRAQEKMKIAINAEDIENAPKAPTGGVRWYLLENSDVTIKRERS